jgi:hypothetical protein
MADHTHSQGTATSPEGYGHCAWHGGYTRDVRLIQIEEAGSGPASAGHRYACHPCQITHGLVPIADR